MPNEEVLEALHQIAREKNVSLDLVADTLEFGLLSAAKKKFGTADNIDVEIDKQSGDISIWQHKAIVHEIEDAALEISLEDALAIDPDAEVGEGVADEIPFSAFGRMAIQSAKQILIQRIREAEREKIYETYSHRIGEILIGTAQQISRRDVIVNLGRAEAVLPYGEQIQRERTRSGDTVRAYMKEVLRTAKGPQIVLSRTHTGFLMSLFEIEVPEIYDGIVEIKAIAREPGNRAKIAVISHDDRVDPVGACVGPKGARVQAVVRELSNERIDIIAWDEDPATFLIHALSPAEVNRVIIEETSHTMTAVVDEDQLSLAIGRGGQNARLAAQLTGWRVEAVSEEQFALREEEVEFLKVAVSDLPDISEEAATALSEAGVHTAEDLVSASAVELADKSGLELEFAADLLDSAQDALEAKQQEWDDEMSRRAEVAAELARQEEEAAADLEESEEDGLQIEEEVRVKQNVPLDTDNMRL